MRSEVIARDEWLKTVEVGHPVTDVLSKPDTFLKVDLHLWIIEAKAHTVCQ